MASPNQPEETPGSTTESPPSPEGPEGRAPQILKLRIVPWDVALTVIVSAVLLIVVTSTSWAARLFAFTENVCISEDCPLVPFGLNYYIYPVMWGGIGAAVAAAVIGPLISMLRGWYMSFWPIMAIGVITLTSVFGYALTGFSESYGR
ncbi:hypothetical protein MB901379_02217 [Mycobacterium basiliense]|uniref:Uncharacterized protein n=1 Tax=Mycobacterium basiliense TaxID=2094119 RepID=A0A447GE01_9MYCO|nr:hypothetical protein [Mycobacterium basiliense]VDM88654.1 hypothetical protein MB901379_02217 [Mycobacterium basiliense]